MPPYYYIVLISMLHLCIDILSVVLYVSVYHIGEVEEWSKFCIYFQDRELTEGSLGGFEVSAIVGGVLLVAVLSLTLTKKYHSVY